MKRYSTKQLLILVSVLAAITAAGCAGIRLTDLERDIAQETAFNLYQIDMYIKAMRLLETDDSYSERVGAIVTEHEQLTSSVPAFLLGASVELPRRVNMSEEEKETLVKEAFPGSQKTLQDAQQLHDELAVALLDNISGNAELIWSIQDPELVQYRHTETFVVAHNAFISAQRNYPDVPIPEAVPYPNQILSLDEQTQTLHASPLDEPLPDIATTAEYLARSHKIYEKILFHYLARKGDSQLTVPEFAAPAASTGTVGADESLGSRILSAIDDTFGVAAPPPEIEGWKHSVYFRRGGYSLHHLTDEEREALRTAVRYFATTLNDTRPEQPLVITLTSTGYSDSTPLRESSKFVRNFIKSLEDSGQVLPKTQPDRKLALNKNFSRLRAQIIQEHVKLLLHEFLGKEQLTIQAEALGKGEELPEGLEEPYTDEDRRICVIILQVR